MWRGTRGSAAGVAFALCLAGSLPLCGQEADVATPRYRMIALSRYAGRDWTAPADLNDRGVVVGSAYDYSPGRSPIALVWVDGKVTPLPAPPGHRATEAAAINASGQIAGSVEKTYQGTRYSYGCLWTDRKPQVLPTPRAHFGTATDVNAAGVVVGWSPAGSRSLPRSWRWQGGKLTWLPLPPAWTVTRECSVNDAGQLVGIAEREGRETNSRALFWEGAAVTELPGLRGSLDTVLRINNCDQGVGSVQTPEGDYHAALWQQGRLIDLGTLGGPTALAAGINDRGQVVGQAELPVTLHPGSNFIETDERAFLWENGTMRDLNSLTRLPPGWRLVGADAINNRGQIVGQGRLGGELRPVLLMPAR